MTLQLDDDLEAQLMNWIPRKLAPQVRVICSLINDTPQHKNMMKRETKPREVMVKYLTLATRKVSQRSWLVVLIRFCTL